LKGVIKKPVKKNRPALQDLIMVWAVRKEKPWEK